MFKLKTQAVLVTQTVEADLAELIQDGSDDQGEQIRALANALQVVIRMLPALAAREAANEIQNQLHPLS